MSSSIPIDHIPLHQWILQQQKIHHTINNITEENKRLDALFQYLIDNNCTSSSIHQSIQLRSTGTSGIGLYTTDTMNNNTVLLNIQAELHIKPTTDTSNTYYNVSPFTSLVLYLLHLPYNINATRYSYIDTLPTVYHNTMNWSRKQLKQLNGCSLLNAIEYSDTELIYTTQIVPHVTKHCELYNNQSITLQQYNYMVSTVMSRAFDVSQQSLDEHNVIENSLPVLVPLADMLNTSVHGESINCYVEWNQSGTYILKSMNTIQPQTELLIEYSTDKLSNSDTLRRYGFIDPTNQHIFIDVSIDSIIELCTMNVDQDEDSLDDVVDNIINNVDRPTIYITDDNQQISTELAILVGCCIQLVDTNTIKQTDIEQKQCIDELTREQQLQLYQLYLLILYQRQSEYNSNIQSDQVLLDKCTTTQWYKSYYGKSKIPSDQSQINIDLYRYKCSLQIRIDEQHVLQKHIDWMKSKIDQLQPVNKKQKI